MKIFAHAQAPVWNVKKIGFVAIVVLSIAFEI